MNAFLAGRRIYLLTISAAVLLTLPSLGAGLVLDDYFHRAVMLGPQRLPRLPPDLFPSNPINGMFAFVDGSPRTLARQMDFGVLPWWTLPELRAAFWRPLTAMTHWLDYRLWPDHVALMHLHSIAWLAALAACVTIFIRRVLGATAAAGLAALAYAIDDARLMPVGFLANRNALTSAVFGVAALIAHDAWRRGGRARFGVLAAVLLALSLLSAEAGAGALAYLFAYAVVLDRGPLRRRLATLLPYVAVTLAWRGAWRFLGFGIFGMGPYVDPIGEPLRFAVAVVRYLPLLLTGQWVGIPTDLWHALRLHNSLGLTVYAMGVAAILAMLLSAMIRRSAAARFMAWGMMLSLVPCCATVPQDRMLTFAGLGGAGLLALFLTEEWRPRGAAVGPASLPARRARRPAPLRVEGEALSSSLALRAGVATPAAMTRRGRFVHVAAILLIFTHFVLAPAGLFVRSFFPVAPRRTLTQLEIHADLGPDVSRQTVVVVNSPVALFAQFLPICRAVEDRPVPDALRVLGPSGVAMHVERRDERTLVLRPEGGFVAFSFDQLFRSPQFAMYPGQTVAMRGMMVCVVRTTDDGRPAEAEFRFDLPLESSSLQWLCWRDGAFKAFMLPAVGEALDLPAPRPALFWE